MARRHVPNPWRDLLTAMALAGGAYLLAVIAFTL